MAAPMLRPCEPWTDELCCAGVVVSDTPEEFEGQDVLVIPTLVAEQALQVATEVLWALSGRRFGTCTTTLRPCREECFPTARGETPWPWWGLTPWSALSAWPSWWAWSPTCAACPGQQCSCRTLQEVELPRGPVTGIEEVIVDGQVLDPAAYRVDEFRRLVRLDGEKWPRCQDLTVDVSHEGTWAVTWSYGLPVPASGMLAAGILACEVAKACLKAPCDLPTRMTSMSRRGTNMVFLDPGEFLDEGRTGIYLVDMFLKAWNPHKLTRRSRVRRADAPVRNWRRVGT